MGVTLKKIIFLPFYVKEFSLENVFKISFLAVAIFHLWAALMTEGFHRPDEHLGVIRMMQHALGHLDATTLSWEFPAQIRSWAQPLTYAMIAKGYYFVGAKDPFVLVGLLRILSSGLALIALFHFMRATSLLFSNELDKKISLSLFPFVWFLPFFHARTSTENFSSSFALLTISLLITLGKSPQRKLFLAFSAGLFSAISFYARLQMVTSLLPAILAFAFIFKGKKLDFLFILIGGLAGLCLNYYVDYLGYDYWALTPWNNLYHNLFKGVASSFGTDPFYSYVTKSFLRGIPPVSIFYLLIPAVYWYKNPKSILTWASFPFFIAHSLIAHKEIRFIYFLGQFIPAMAPFVISQFQLSQSNLRPRFEKYFILVTKFSLALSLVLVLFSSSRNAFSHLNIYKSFHKMSSPPETIYTLNVVRDVLEIYLPKNVSFQHLAKLPAHLEQQTYFITDSYEDWEKLNALFKCTELYSEYMDYLFPYFKKLKKRKDWIFFKCPK